jgi:hypothetical protein
MTIISVGRAGQEIGTYDFDGVKEGLATGYFLADDWGWYEGLPEWLPLPMIVEKLGTLPDPPVSTAIPPPFVAPPAVQPHLTAPIPAPPQIKQDLTPQRGTVTYVLKQPRSKKPAKRVPALPSWQNDPATEKQIAFLTNLGVRNIPASLTKGEAHNQIDALLAKGQAHIFLSPKQRACLHYYGFDEEKMDFDEAKNWLDRVHDNPESFNVPEPWETAKYRLYPSLYPASERPRRKGCIPLLFVIVFCGSALIFLLLRLAH